MFKRPRGELSLFIVTVSRGAGIIFGIFTAIVAIVMIANYIQLESHDPLNNAVLEQLLTSYRSNPSDSDVKDQIRALDLVARKAFFVRRRQLETGTYLLLIGAALTVVAARLATLFAREFPKGQKPGLLKPKGRMFLSALGAMVLIASIVSSVLAGRLAFPESSQSLATLTDDADMFPPMYEKAWPGFRGPFGNGISKTASPPLSWNRETGEGVLWETEVSLPGFGSPIVWSDRIYLSGADTERQTIFCWDTMTGSLIWQVDVGPFPGSPKSSPKVTADTGLAAATPATNGIAIFAVFASGDIGAFNVEGNPIWGRNLGVPDNHYGHSSSLLTYGENVVVLYDHMEEATLFLLDGRTGNTIWKTERDPMTNWSSPVIRRIAEGDEILVNGNPSFVAYDAASGDELYSYDEVLGEVASSPAYGQTQSGDDRVVFINQLLSIICLDGQTGTLVWELYDDLPDATSPLIYGGRVYIATSYGVFTCIDLEDGTILWKEEFSDGFYATPIAAADRIIVIDLKGLVRMITPADSFLLAGEYSLGVPVVTTPAVVGSTMYVRTDDQLIALTNADE